MVRKRAICFALGGHISNQNASFRKLAELLPSYEFFGAEDGFKAFETGRVIPFYSDSIPRSFAGFYAGAGRASLMKKVDGKEVVDEDKMAEALNFFDRGKFDIAIGSGGDDHGMQMALLNKYLEGKVGVYVLNKTMDNDLGGRDTAETGSYTDFTNGFHTAVSVGVKKMKTHFAGAWTNNLPYLIGTFGRETNWVSIALAYYGNADRIIYGELHDKHKGHDIEEVYNAIVASQKKNQEKYGRKFAMIIVPEGTRISGIKHSSGLIDPHGHHKLEPAILVAKLKEELETRFKLKTQTDALAYELRNSRPTEDDALYGEWSAEVLARAIRKGESGVESLFKIEGGRINVGVAPIEKVSAKRYAMDYENAKHRLFYDRKTFEVSDEIGRYYKPLFGERDDLASWLPSKPKVVII